MPLQQGQIVTGIIAAAGNALASFTSPNGQLNAYLSYDNPGYSSIFTLLMAAAVNKKPIDVTTDDPGPNEPLTILAVSFSF